MSMKPILEIQGVSKKFRISARKKTYLSLREHMLGLFRAADNQEDYWALDDVSFEVFPSECVGIIGKNGAGKSTLLKILSKITPPTKGKIITRGRIASLLEVGTGFHPELTGRENVYLNGSILGLKQAEINRHFDAIVDFSGVEKFIDTPLKRYSSGMQLRLAFAVAAHLEPEILIIDEVLAVGDAEFQKKCLGKMDEVSKGGRTVLFVSHNMGTLQQLCRKGVFLQKGVVKLVSSIDKVIEEYQQSGQLGTYYEESRATANMVSRIYVKNDKPQFGTNESIELTIELKGPVNKRYTLLVSILDMNNQVICSSLQKIEKETYDFLIPDNFFARGKYIVQTVVYIPAAEVLQRIEEACSFEIIDSGTAFASINDYNYGKVFGNFKWT